MRAEFADKVKKELAHRVAWRCSFAGCSRNTVGPKTELDDGFVVLGEAAHIYAASEGGPRPNPEMTVEERSSIKNGIWMCKAHARLIDVDELNYSAETLQLWKQKAEEDAYSSLHSLEREESCSLETLISFNDLIFSGIWLSSVDDIWTFEIASFVEGSIEQLRSACNDFSETPSFSRYIVVESQGDGRQISKVSWKISENKRYLLCCSVLPKSKRIDPNKLVGGIAIGDDFDLAINEETGDFALVQGIDSAIQDMRIALSSNFGDFKEFPSLGCYFPQHYSKYKHKTLLLNKLLKIEIIRLLTVPVPDLSLIKSPTPAFNFINRILNVAVPNVEPVNDQVPVKIHLEWGNLKTWIGIINLSIAERSVEYLADDEMFGELFKILNRAP